LGRSIPGAETTGRLHISRKGGCTFRSHETLRGKSPEINQGATGKEATTPSKAQGRGTYED
ncbi:hypothetical protein T03_17333, partial [Trichinella britovi]